MTPQPQNLPRWRIWALAARPKTLWAGAIPVLMGGAMGFQSGEFYWIPLLAAMAGSVTIQVGTNFANDLFDFLNKADTSDRIGPTRVTHAGLVSVDEMKTATILVFAISVIVGLYLVLHGGIVILLIGSFSILFGISYTAGPYPLGYTGWADLFVLIFFGPVAVAGTHYVTTLEFTLTSVLAGLPAGMISTAILAVNNLRDYDTDKKAGKKTLAVRFGRTFVRLEYLIMIIGAMLFPVLLGQMEPDHPWVTIAAATTLMAIPSIVKVMKMTGPGLNEVLAQTGKILAVFGLLFSLGWNL